MRGNFGRGTAVVALDGEAEWSATALFCAGTSANMTAVPVACTYRRESS